MRYLKLFEKHSKELILYHASWSKFDRFDLDKDKGMNIFGKAFYFSNSNGNIGQFGLSSRYKVTLENTLDLNKEISLMVADKLYAKFSQIIPLKEYSFLENYWVDMGEVDEEALDLSDQDPIQIGEFLEQVMEVSGADIDLIYNNIGKFIMSMGYDSFKHYADSGTNYRLEKPWGKYDEVFITYGLYDASKIETID